MRVLMGQQTLRPGRRKVQVRAYLGTQVHTQVATERRDGLPSRVEAGHDDGVPVMVGAVDGKQIRCPVCANWNGPFVEIVTRCSDDSQLIRPVGPAGQGQDGIHVTDRGELRVVVWILARYNCR